MVTSPDCNNPLLYAERQNQGQVIMSAYSVAYRLRNEISPIDRYLGEK